MRGKVWPKMRVVHYLMYQSSIHKVAHCLDLDLVASGQSARYTVASLCADPTQD